MDCLLPGIKIKEVDVNDVEIGRYVAPDFIKNRIDLWQYDKEKVKLFYAEYDSKEYAVFLLLGHPRAEIGVWLSNIPSTVFTELVNFIFQKYPEIRYIKYRNSLVDYGGLTVNWS